MKEAIVILFWMSSEKFQMLKTTLYWNNHHILWFHPGILYNLKCFTTCDYLAQNVEMKIFSQSSLINIIRSIFQ